MVRHVPRGSKPQPKTARTHGKRGLYGDARTTRGAAARRSARVSAVSGLRAELFESQTLAAAARNREAALAAARRGEEVARQIPLS
eukprot:scaffold79458_cov54-Phaeocystis_antarctica.AAC.1